MFLSYLKSAVRNLLADKVATVLNVIGLSIALASAITVYLFLQVFYTLDTSHDNNGRIQLVEHVATRDGEAQTWGTAPLPLGPELESSLTQVERAVRMGWAVGTVRTAEAVFKERVSFGEPGFFDVFTFPLQAGSPAVLEEAGQAVLSDATARAYFGEANPIGQTLTISFENATQRTVTVAAVASPFPNNASLRFSVLLPFAARPDAARDDDWTAQAAATFLLLRTPDDAPAVTAQMERYRSRVNEAAPEVLVDRFVLETVGDPGPDAHTVRQRPIEAPHPAVSLVMIGLAVAMMALACVNTVNIALGNASRRMREIGIRKVLGGSRGQLVAQFLAENLVLCGMALVASIGLAWLFLIPLFNQLFVMQTSLSFAGEHLFWAFLLGLLLLVGVASGAYPALVGASFQPSKIFRGTARPAAKRRLTHGLMLLQFVLAFLAVIGTVVLVLNGRYLSGQDWGYAKEGVVAVRLSGDSQFELLRDAADQHTDVIRVVGTPNHVGDGNGRIRFALDQDALDQPPAREAQVLNVSPGYAETIGLQLRTGRFFDERLASDASDAVMVNARFVREQGWTDPVGESIRLEGRDVAVIGVVEDFLYNPALRPQPMILRASAALPQVLVARVRPGSEVAMQDALAADWARLVPDQPFEGFAQSEVFDAQIDSYITFVRGIGVLAVLALGIGCMGVFGVASQNVTRTLKEAGIRKVLGASVAQLVVRFNWSILVVMTVSAVLATGISATGLALVARLEAVNLIALSPVPFVLAYGLVLLAVGVSVASQSRTLSLCNPADVLRRD